MAVLGVHLGIKRDRYVVFDDTRSYEQGLIRLKWPFLPSAFHSDVDAASVLMEGRLWTYTFVKDGQAVVFNDHGLLNRALPPFPEGVRQNMDALTAFYEYNVPAHIASVGNTLYHYDTVRGLGPPFQVPSVVPADFRGGFDDISVEQEGDAFKVSLYKGYERLIYVDSVFGSDYVIERLDVRAKWRFLQTFFDVTV